MPTKSKKPGRPRKGKELRIRSSFTLEPGHIKSLKVLAREQGKSASEFLGSAIERLSAKKLDSSFLLSNFAKLRRNLDQLAQRYQVKNFSLFGSVVHEKSTPESDVDILVEFQPEAKVSMFDMVKLEAELSQLLDGRKVDLRTKNDLSEHFREDVLRESVPLYSCTS